MSSSKQYNYLGVDLGTSSIKVLEFASYKGKPKLVTYGFSERKLAEVGRDSVLEKPELTAALIDDICKKARVTTKKVITALPNFSVFSSIITLPEMSKKDLSSAITYEAKKIIPTPIEDIILDWKIIEQYQPSSLVAGEGVQAVLPANDQENFVRKIFSKPKNYLKILLTGANRNLVKKYVKVFDILGMSLLSLDTESFALIRSLIGNDKSTIAILDLGASTSSIMVVDGGLPYLTKSLDGGGLMITRAISGSLNVNLDRAEQFKHDIMMDVETAENALPQTVEKSIAPIINEVKYTIDLFQQQNGKKVEKIILTGGTALLGHLPAYISTALNINTVIGDSFSKVVYPVELKPIIDNISPRFAVAAGLAMRNIE